MTYNPQRDGAWQRLLKAKYRAEDLASLGKNETWADSLRTRDFTIRLATTPADWGAAKAFIGRYEALGGPPKRGYNPVVILVEEKSTGALAGVTWFVSPNKPSKVMPGVTEWLLARGATVSWAPRNLGTWMTTRALDLLVKHTGGAVLVSGYADPTAGERGGIYRAANWRCVKSNAGASKLYCHPSKPSYWFGDRKFGIRSTWIKFAKQEGVLDRIVWRATTPTGTTSWTPDWTKTPPEVVERLKTAIRAWRSECTSRTIPPKSKWSTVRGRTPKETKHLLRKLRDGRETSGAADRRTQAATDGDVRGGVGGQDVDAVPAGQP